MTMNHGMNHDHDGNGEDNLDEHVPVDRVHSPHHTSLVMMKVTNKANNGLAWTYSGTK